MKVPQLLLLLACVSLAAAAASEGRPRKRLPLVSTDVAPSPEPAEDATDASRPAKQHQRNNNQHPGILFPPGLEGPEPSNSTKCFHIRVAKRRGRRRHQKRRKEEDAADAQATTDATVADPEDASDVLTVRKNRKHLIPSNFICTNRRKNRRRKGSQRKQGTVEDDSADEDIDGKTRRRRRLSHLALKSLQRESV